MRRYSSIDQYLDYLRKKRFLASETMLRNLADAALKRDPDGLYSLRLDPVLLEPWTDSPRSEQLWAQLAGLRCPGLVVRGAGSAILSRNVAERMLRVNRLLIFREVRLAGHGLITDSPDEFADAVLPFVRQYP